MSFFFTVYVGRTRQNFYNSFSHCRAVSHNTGSAGANALSNFSFLSWFLIRRRRTADKQIRRGEIISMAVKERGEFRLPGSKGWRKDQYFEANILSVFAGFSTLYHGGYVLAFNYTFNWSLVLVFPQYGKGKLIRRDTRCAPSLFTKYINSYPFQGSPSKLRHCQTLDNRGLLKNGPNFILG